MSIELSAQFERESAPVAQWIRAADFGVSGPKRCGPSVNGRAKRVELSAVFRHRSEAATPRAASTPLRAAGQVTQPDYDAKLADILDDL
jgi:hypothetical protein